MTKRRTEKDRDRLGALIQEATVDCYGPEEQVTGLLCMIDESVVFPFRAKVIGEAVEVLKFDCSRNGDSLDAICKRKGKEHRVDVSSLEWIEPHTEGFEWIEAYLAWREWNS
jgi:hypothetical protein